MPLNSASIFRQILLQMSKHSFQQYKNSPTRIQSSVGMIFRVQSDGHYHSKESFLALDLREIQLLFTQRAGFERDSNAYNIVFPGGQCDNDETDLEACKRQLMEEISLNTQEKCIYLGQLPSNFYYVMKRGKQMFMSCHVWVMKQDQYHFQPTLNQQELRAYAWVDFKELLQITNYQMIPMKEWGLFSKISPGILKSSLQRNILSVFVPSLDLKMDRKLWGLTLWLWSYFLQMSKFQQTNKIKEFIQQIDFTFKPLYIFKPLLKIGSKAWIYFYRTKQFTYNKQKIKKHNITIVICTILFLVLLASFFY